MGSHKGQKRRDGQRPPVRFNPVFRGGCGWEGRLSSACYSHFPPHEMSRKLLAGSSLILNICPRMSAMSQDAHAGAPPPPPSPPTCFLSQVSCLRKSHSFCSVVQAANRRLVLESSLVSPPTWISRHRALFLCSS